MTQLLSLKRYIRGNKTQNMVQEKLKNNILVLSLRYAHWKEFSIWTESSGSFPTPEEAMKVDSLEKWIHKL
jgi:hypothetical protein